MAIACNAASDDVATSADPSPPVGDGGRGGQGGTGGGGSPSGGAAELHDDACEPAVLAIDGGSTDVYILLDKSSSMADPVLGVDGVTRWESAVQAIQRFAESARGSGTGVGLQYFGLQDTCNPNAYAAPAVPIASSGGSDDIAASLAAQTPDTMTPMAPALQGGLRYMRAWAVDHPERRVVVALVTDGFPTECGLACDDDADCVHSTCTSGMCDSATALREMAALAEAYAAEDPPVFTGVVGLEAGLSVLDDIARRAGSTSALLPVVDDLSSAITLALGSLVRSPLACSLALPQLPADLEPPLDPEHFSVDIGDGEALPRVSDAEQCVDGAGEGWYFDDAVAPTRLHLCPQSCARFTPESAAFLVGCAPPRPE